MEDGRCKHCKHMIYSEDEKVYNINGITYCETCWIEHVCHICSHEQQDPDYYYCEKCNRSVSLECGCIEKSTFQAQYHGCICNDCYRD